MFYTVYSPDSAPKRKRPEGHRAVVDLLKDSNLKNNDKVLITYYGEDKFKKYLLPTMEYKFYTINKFNFNYPLFNGDNYFEVIKNGKSRYKEFFKEFPNKTIEKYVHSNILYDLNKNDRVGFIVLEGVSFIDNNSLQKILDSEERYKSIPFIFLVFSSVRNNVLYTLDNTLEFESKTKWGDWTLYVYKKN